MSEGQPQQRKVPSDFTQIPIVWRYELLKYLRSRRLIASIAIAFVVIGLIYILPPALGNPYSGSETGSNVTVVGLDVLGLPPGTLPYQSIGLFNKTGVSLSSLTISVNGTEIPRGATTWLISGTNGAPKVDIPGVDVVLLFVVNVTGSDVTASYDWNVPAEQFDGTFLNFASILIVICATFFGADAIVGEYQNRTGYLMFPNPIKRGSLFFGKYAASMTAGIVVIGIFYASITILSLLTIGKIDADLGLSFAYAFEYLLAVMAIAYFISSILKGTTGATVLTFFMFVMILPIVDGVSSVAGVKISASITFAAGVLQYILQDPYPHDSTQAVGGMTFHSYYPDPAMAALTIFIYAAVAIVLSLILFKRKELSG